MAQHTHRGTCAACGSVQAVNPNSGAIAKHGYTRKYGWQMGACNGSRELSAEQSNEFGRLLADRLVRFAEELEARTLESITSVVLTLGRGRDSQTVRVSSEEEYRVHRPFPMHYDGYEAARVNALRALHREAGERREHAAFVLKLGVERLGQPLYPVAAEAEKVSRFFSDRESREARHAYVAELEAVGYKVITRRDRVMRGFTVYGSRVSA